MIRARTVVPAVAAAVALTVAGCGSSTTTSDDTTTTSAATTTAGAVEVKNPWARATIGEAKNTGVFMTLDNSTSTDDKLVGASVASSVAREVQLHETVTASDSTSTMAGHGGSMQMEEEGMSSDMAGMRQVAEIEVPAGASTELKPGGYHVMLIDLAKPLVVGDTFELTLQFEKAGSQQVQVTAKEM